MIVLGIDFETTGLDPAKHRIIEVGAVLWDTSTATPISCESIFCTSTNLPDMEPEAFAAHGLSKHFLEEYGVGIEVGLDCIDSLCRKAQTFVGHNCMQFDKPFYLSECNRAAVRPVNLPWIDTSCDIKYPSHITTRKLVHLAAEHGFLNPFAHRAMFDVLTMLMIFQRYDPVAALALAQEPFVTLKACVSYDDREKAKARGYRWKDRQWLKSMRASEVEQERRDCGFTVIEITPLGAQAEKTKENENARAGDVTS